MAQQTSAQQTSGFSRPDVMSFRSRSQTQSRSSRAVRVAPWGIFSSAGIICRVAASGLLRRPAPTAGQGPLTGEAPWPLRALCISAVSPYIF